MFRRLAKNTIKSALGAIGYRLQPADVDPQCEGFDRHLASARREGMDVNDWLREKRGWDDPRILLEKPVFPLISNTAAVCEIGPGTGRHARELAGFLAQGELHLFDHSSWVRVFLKDYFAGRRNVVVHDGDGASLDLPDNSADLVLSLNVFVETKLGVIRRFAREFARVLKPGGHAVFNYLDITTDAGWEVLNSRSDEKSDVFAYHTAETIARVFTEAGFQSAEQTPVDRTILGTWTKE